MDAVQINLELVTSAFKSALADAQKNTDSFSKNTKSSFLAVQNTFSTMAGVLGANALTSVFGSITGSIGRMVEEAAKSEAAINDLNTSLKQAGLYSQSSSKELQDFASALQAVTIYGDEAIMASSSLLLSLTTLDVQGIEKATKAALNLATTLNIDLSTATTLIAKAVNGHAEAFSRYGIQIEKGKDSSQNLANVLRALQSQQGAAEAKTQTYAGATAQLANAQGDLIKTLGKLYTENSAVIGSINSISSAFSKSAEWVAENKTFLSDLIKTVEITVGVVGAAALAWAAYTFATTSAFAGTVALASAISGASIASTVLTAAASTAWVAITGPVGLAVIGIAALGTAIYGLVKYWDQVKAATYNALATTLEYSSKVVGLVNTGLAQTLKNEAQAYREKAQATLEASQQAQNSGVIDGQQAQQRKARLAQELAEKQRKNALELAIAQQQAASLNLIEQDRLLGLQEQENAHNQAMLEIDSQFDAVALQNRLAQQAQELANRQAYEQQLLQVSLDAEMAKAKSVEDAEARKTAIRDAANKAAIEKTKLTAKQDLELKKQNNKAEQELDKRRVSDRRDTLSTIASLQNSNNKYLATIGKAAAITQIAIETPVAIAKALSAFPPPANFIAAGVVGVAMAAQAAAIAGVNFADGGIVPGSNYTGDRVRANLNSGEMVLNKNQQTTLFKLANSNSTGVDNSQTNALLVELVQAVKANQNTSIQINGREIVGVVREGLKAGRSI